MGRRREPGGGRRGLEGTTEEDKADTLLDRDDNVFYITIAAQGEQNAQFRFSVRKRVKFDEEDKDNSTETVLANMAFLGMGEEHRGFVGGSENAPDYFAFLVDAQNALDLSLTVTPALRMLVGVWD